MKRRVLIILSILAGVAIAIIVVANPLVSTILKSKRHALLSDQIMLITMKKQGASHMITFPVNYLREKDIVSVGCDTGWWKHLAGGAEVHMLIAGNELIGWATPILDDPDRISAGLKKLRPSTYQWALWTGAVFLEIRIQ